MNYYETTQYLFNQLPAFEKKGASDYKPGLETSLILASSLGNPHNKFKSIHIAGTNGKGSTAHTLAAILQAAGYKTGLYTSPHLIDFRERIRIDGKMIPEDRVVNFVERYKQSPLCEDISPTFFELTTLMAFEWFADESVDIAVIETGLGGRLDTTNIISPELSIITNISLDHTDLLGDTLEKIAIEKAGIIKPNTPVVIGESCGVAQVFKVVADKSGSKITFAEDNDEIISCKEVTEGGWLYDTRDFGEIQGELSGVWQPKNAATILSAVSILIDAGWNIPCEAVRKGFADVCEMTGLMGRWMKLASTPDIVCDTGHNPGGWKYISRQLEKHIGKLKMVIGFVKDKDVNTILGMMPKDADYYFTNAHTKRALSADELKTMALTERLIGESYDSVTEALKKARSQSDPGDLIFVGGSNYLIAELLRAHPTKKC